MRPQFSESSASSGYATTTSAKSRLPLEGRRESADGVQPHGVFVAGYYFPRASTLLYFTTWLDVPAMFDYFFRVIWNIFIILIND
jgi:hypothetical protein